MIYLIRFETMPRGLTGRKEGFKDKDLVLGSSDTVDGKTGNRGERYHLQRD